MLSYILIRIGWQIKEVPIEDKGQVTMGHISDDLGRFNQSLKAYDKEDSLHF